MERDARFADGLQPAPRIAVQAAPQESTDVRRHGFGNRRFLHDHRGQNLGVTSWPPDAWKQGGVLYEVQMKASQAKIVRLVNQAIKAGPR